MSRQEQLQAAYERRNGIADGLALIDSRNAVINNELLQHESLEMAKARKDLDDEYGNFFKRFKELIDQHKAIFGNNEHIHETSMQSVKNKTSYMVFVDSINEAWVSEKKKLLKLSTSGSGHPRREQLLTEIGMLEFQRADRYRHMSEITAEIDRLEWPLQPMI